MFVFHSNVIPDNVDILCDDGDVNLKNVTQQQHQ